MPGMFKLLIAKWQNSKEFYQLRSILVKYLSTTLSSISSIITFAYSSIAFEADYTLPSMVRHALILSLRDLLSTGDTKIQCFA
jgi:hypothetical protein